MSGDTKMKEAVCAIVVTYNRLTLLGECIEALHGQTRTVDKILVVNNGSTDGTQDWLNQQPSLWVIHQENLGGAGGFHRGVKEAHAAGYEWLWLMDDDVIPHAFALEQLTKVAADIPAVGFLASRVVSRDGQPLNVPTLDTRILPNGSARWLEFADRGLLSIKAATFVSVLVSKTAVDTVGLPMAEMFIWGDDIEYTTRITRSLPAFLVLTSCVIHARANQRHLSIVGETNPARLKMFRYHYRNAIYIAVQYRDYKLLLYQLYCSLRDVVRSLSGQQKMVKLRVIASGVFEGLVMASSKNR